MVKRLAIFGLALLSLAAVAACDNPFDPLDDKAEISGLSYIDFSAEWSRWDSDPEFDGVKLTLEYLNMYGESLEFTDKPHQVTIEFYSQRNVGGTKDDAGNVTGGYWTYNQLLFSHTVSFKNTTHDIRIPVELYQHTLSGVKDDEGTAMVYIMVHVYPPAQMPQRELVVGYPDKVVYKLEQPPTPNE
jgi:hypothetical protein